MKTKIEASKPLALVTGALIFYALNLVAQPAPTITTQPASQTNLVGANTTFSVTVAGTGPFTYQWRLNGSNLPINIINIVAGNGSFGFYGDGGVATQANLNSPYGVTLDAARNLFIADFSNNRVRRVDTNGIITTVAGNSIAGYSGDGAAATNASLSGPVNVAFDVAGNLYFSDQNNQRIRKVDTNGIISTVAGNGSMTNAGDGGAATNASLNYPFGVTLDSLGNLYISDTSNNRIRKVDTNGIISTVAGNGTAGYSGDGGAATNASLNVPCGMTSDAKGDFYFADDGNNRIREVDTNGVITTVAGGCSGGTNGAATNACMNNPKSVTLDSAGDMFIADASNDFIWMVDTNGIISVVAGTGDYGDSGDGGPATSAEFLFPVGVAVDSSGNLYIADSGNSNIREVHVGESPVLALNALNTNDDGNYSVVITSPYGSVTSAVASLLVVLRPAIVVQPASQGVMTGSNATLSVTATGTSPLYYSWYYDATNLVQDDTNASLNLSAMSATNAGQYIVVVTNAYGSVTSQVAMVIASVPSPPSVTIPPANQAVPGANVAFKATVDGSGPFNYQWQFNGTNFPHDIISTVAGHGGGGYAGDGGAAVNANLYLPIDVAFDGAGNLYIADSNNKRIRKVYTDGIISTVAGDGGEGYAGDGGPATSALLYDPFGVVLDSVGNLYIADSGNNRIRKVDTNGIIRTVAGNGNGAYTGDGGEATNASLIFPSGVAFDACGNLYIADSGNNRIRKVDTNGIIRTVAGNGNGAYAGDGGKAYNATLNYPTGVAFDASGSLYIADEGNNRVRKVDTNGIITTLAGNGNAGYSGDGGAALNASFYTPSSVVVDAVGNLYIADENNQRIRKVDTNWIITTVAGNGNRTFAGDGGGATNASLFFPAGVSLDAAGNLYIADAQNQRIRRVLLDAGNPTFTLFNVGATNAGDYTVVITSPYGTVTSSVTTLTVQAPAVITVQPTNQLVLPGSDPFFSVTVVGSGPFEYLWYFDGTNLVQSGTNSMFTLSAVSTNQAGSYSVVITNAYGSVTSSLALLTLVDTAPAIAAQPYSQTVVAGNNTSFGVTAVGNPAPYYQWRLNGTNLLNLPKIITTVAGNGGYGFSGDGGPALSAEFANAIAATADAFGNVFVADRYNNRVRKVSTNGTITTVAGNGSIGISVNGRAATNTPVYNPSFVIADPTGNLYIAENGANYIARVGTNGLLTNVVGKGAPFFSGDGGPATSAYINSPYGIALDVLGNLFIADTGNNRIRGVGTNGIISTIAGKTGASFSGDGGQATNANLNAPHGVFLDSYGNLFIADTGNNRIRKVATNSIITTIAGNGAGGTLGSFSGDGGAATNAGLEQPNSIAVDASGNLFIADSSDGRIRQVDTNGTITTIGGGGTIFPGDGGAATSAFLYNVTCVALDANGNIFITDTGNERIQEMPSSSPILLLNSVGTADAGDYSVVISNLYGSITSSVARLTVTIATTPPQIITSDAHFGVQSNLFGFNVVGAFEQTIVLDASTDLVNWTPLLTNNVVTNPFYFFDPAWTNFPWRFYRARLP